jgi:hypothetical protein
LFKDTRAFYLPFGRGFLKSVMYNVSEIKAGLIGSIGWRQNADSTGTQLTEMTASETGLYFNEVHPLLTFDNIESIAPQFNLTNANQAAINAAYTAWLKQKTEASILKAVNAWTDAKMQNRTAKNLLANNLLFPHTINTTDKDQNKSEIVGIELTQKRSKSIRTKVRKIGIQLVANQTIDVMLYRNGSAFPVETQSVVYAGAGANQWVAVDWTLEGNNTYHIAYDQTDLEGTNVAINGVYEYSFNSFGALNFPTENYYKASAFSTSGTFQQSKYTVSTNYGLNLDLDVRCDYTAFILEQKDLFKNLIWYQVGLDFLRELAFNANARVNRNEANTDYQTIIYEIDGDSQGRNTNTVSGRYDAALKAIQFDETGIDSVCLPCKRRGIRYKALGPR